MLITAIVADGVGADGLAVEADDNLAVDHPDLHAATGEAPSGLVGGGGEAHGSP